LVPFACYLPWCFVVELLLTIPSKLPTSRRPSAVRRRLDTAASMLAPAAIPGLTRPPIPYRQGRPIPASELGLALLGFAALLAFGAMLAWLWNRSNAR
jgi:hypothetical protein